MTTYRRAGAALIAVLTLLLLRRATAVPRQTLVFLSMQHHPDWVATTPDGRQLTTVRVNDFYLAVVLPPDTHEVLLRFSPFVLWSWVPQAGFVVAAPGCLAHRRVRSTKLSSNQRSHTSLTS